MEFNYNKLRGRIKEYYGNQSDLAQSIHISSNSLSSKLNNKVRFTQDEIYNIMQRLDINKSEIYEYFFTLKV